MTEPMTGEMIMHIFELIIAIVAGITAVVALLKWITQIHDRNKKLDGYEKEIEDVKKSIDDLKADNDLKMTALREEQFIITDSMLAILEGLHQLNCNGPVTEARDKLIDYINDRAHKQVF